MRKALIIISLLASLLFMPLTANAGIDTAAIIAALMKIFNVDIKQLDELNSLKDVSNRTLDELRHDLSGNFGYGNLLNTPYDLNKKLWSNDSWFDVLNRVSTDKTSAFAKAQDEYAKLYPVVNADQIGTTQKNGGLTRIFYEQNSNISRAALAASSYTFNQINQHIQNIHDILLKLESQPSAKAAIDLNTRLVAELSFIQLETLKQQTMQTQISATQTQNQVNGMSNESKFLQMKPF